jgi:hypothetical protein
VSVWVRDVEEEVATNSDAGLAASCWPEDQLDGSVLRPVWLLVNEVVPVPLWSWKTREPEPVGARIAIQYTVPEVTCVVGIVALFHIPARGELIVPWATSAPGEPLLSA